MKITADAKGIHCVQCQEELIEHLPFLYVCNNPKCPNYGLIQAGIENVIRYTDVEDIENM